MPSVEPKSQYNEIETLSCEIVKLLQQNEFEEVNLLLSRRLTLLKKLDVYIKSSSSFDKLRTSYEQFIIDLQKKDGVQLDLLLKEKSKLLKLSLEQLKTKKAILAYKNVTLG